MTLPITVVIATRNRWPQLMQTLAALSDEDVADVVVVDDASTDETRDQLAKSFPAVVRIRNEHSQGVPGFGSGLAAVRTKYAFLLDDDATPSPGAMEHVVSRFEENAMTAVVACHIMLPTGESVTDRWPEYPPCFWGCGAGVRVAAISEQPYLFDHRLRLHGTELDLAARLYDRGYVVRYEPQAVVVHRVSELNLSPRLRVRHVTMGAVWFPLKHLPWSLALPALVRHLTYQGLRSLRQGLFRAFARGLADAVHGLPGVLAERQPVRADVADFYRRAVWEYEPLTHRLGRAVSGRPAPRREHPVGYAGAVARPRDRIGRTARLIP